MAKIPKVDDGIKGQKDMAYEETQRFYAKHNIPEYVHPVSGGKFLKFEFGELMSMYKDSDEEDFENPIVRQLSYVEVNKKSFLNNINGCARYINYFIKYFDDDDELMMTYYFMMYSIMNKEIKLEPADFIINLKTYIGTSTMVDKIARMVDYNTDESMLNKSERSAYDPSIQLTADHLKAIMGLSCMHKMIIPIVSQYYNVYKDELKAAKITDRELYFRVFSQFIECFDTRYDIQLYDKIYHTATTRISKTENRDSLMWGRRSRVGVTPVAYANVLMRDLFIDISQKVVFNKSAIIFIHVCFDKAIRNELIQQDRYEYAEMDTIASDSVNGTMSKWDQWQTANTHTDERSVFRRGASIKDCIYRHCRENGIDLTSPKTVEEYAFYRDNITKLEDVQLNLLYLYFASDLGSYDVLKSMKRSDLNHLIMIMKKELTDRNYVYIPQFISGKMNMFKAKRYNRKKIERAFKQHPCYDDWIEQYGSAKDLLSEDKVYAMVKSLISCPIDIVDYNYQEFNDKTLAVDETSAVDEMIKFLLSL